MPIFEHTNCDICGAELSDPLINFDYLSFSCKVSICMNCGLVKLNPRWIESKYIDFYTHKYDFFYRGSDKSPEELFENDLLMKGKLMNERLSQINFQDKISVLDVGCGTGFSFYQFSDEIEVDAYAIEPSITLHPFLLSKDINLIGTDLSCDWGGKFDLIVARHTLEHTLDPISFLTKIKKHLKDDGAAYIVVPNAMYFNDNKSHSFFRHVHTYYFNLNTLAQISALAGLSIVTQSTGSNVSSDGPAEIWTILKKEGEHFNIPEISPSDQLQILEMYSNSSKFSLKRRIWSNLKRIYHRA